MLLIRIFTFLACLIIPGQADANFSTTVSEDNVATKPKVDNMGVDPGNTTISKECFVIIVGAVRSCHYVAKIAPLALNPWLVPPGLAFLTLPGIIIHLPPHIQGHLTTPPSHHGSSAKPPNTTVCDDFVKANDCVIQAGCSKCNSSDADKMDEAFRSAAKVLLNVSSHCHTYEASPSLDTARCLNTRLIIVIVIIAGAIAAVLLLLISIVIVSRCCPHGHSKGHKRSSSHRSHSRRHHRSTSRVSRRGSRKASRRPTRRHH